MSERGPLTGKILDNKYRIEEQLGIGGFGTVYKATNIRLNRLQAIKVINDSHLSNAQFQQRFEREAQTLASLNHPNILHVDDYGIDNGRPYLVMPFVSGGTLRTVIPSNGLNLEQTGIYLRQICEALDYVHAQKIVHLDLKPINLLHRNGTLLLSDFGLAHIMNEGVVIGGKSLLFGTPGYVAPEQAIGNPQRASDIYALGGVLFCMVTGRNPTTYAPSAHAVKAAIPSSIDDIIKRAMAIEPANRYSSAGALFNDFKTKVGIPLQPVASPQITNVNRPIQNSPNPPNPPVAPKVHTTNQSPRSQQTGRTVETTGSLSIHTITPYAQVQLDAPPPLDVMNRLIEEVGRQAQQRKQGSKEENTK